MFKATINRTLARRPSSLFRGDFRLAPSTVLRAGLLVPFRAQSRNLRWPFLDNDSWYRQLTAAST